MYNPKISEDLVHVVYKIGKMEGRPMTKVLNSIIREYLDQKYPELMRLEPRPDYDPFGKAAEGNRNNIRKFEL